MVAMEVVNGIANEVAPSNQVMSSLTEDGNEIISQSRTSIR